MNCDKWNQEQTCWAVVFCFAVFQTAERPIFELNSFKIIYVNYIWPSIDITVWHTLKIPCKNDRKKIDEQLFTFMQIIGKKRRKKCMKIIWKSSSCETSQHKNEILSNHLECAAIGMHMLNGMSVMKIRLAQRQHRHVDAQILIFKHAYSTFRLSNDDKLFNYIS